MNNQQILDILRNIYIAILLVVFGGIVLHAPLSVLGGVLLPDYDLLIKSWKEILIAVAVIAGVALLVKNHQLKLLKDPIIVLIGVYILIHLLSAVLIKNNILSILAGLLIDLRYVVFFVLVYLAVKMWPCCRRLFIKVAVVGEMTVLVFAMLQVFVLPRDILKHIGYGMGTIAPYMTVDQNYDFVRINSTLRGPNPLGAYSVIVLALSLAYLIKNRIKKDTKKIILWVILIVGGLVALWFSYSRSALVAGIMSVGIVFILGLSRKIFIKTMLVGGALLLSLVAVSGLLVDNHNYLISNIILHEDPGESVNVNSNDDHASSLMTGVELLFRQPFGAGIGSTGSASLHGDNPIIIENQYLFVAHEAGWLGLVIFAVIFGFILVRLWNLRKDWLALGVFASGLGLAAIGLLLPVWVDDTVAIIWWGLAAVALSGRN